MRRKDPTIHLQKNSASAQELTRMLTQTLRSIFDRDDACPTSDTPAAQECKCPRCAKLLWRWAAF